MKNYKDVAESVFARSDAIIKEKNRRRKNITRVCSVVIPCFAVAVLSAVMWRNDFFAERFPDSKDRPVIAESSEENTTEYTTEETDHNFYPDVEDTKDIIEEQTGEDSNVHYEPVEDSYEESVNEDSNVEIPSKPIDESSIDIGPIETPPEESIYIEPSEEPPLESEYSENSYCGQEPNYSENSHEENSSDIDDEPDETQWNGITVSGYLYNCLEAADDDYVFTIYANLVYDPLECDYIYEGKPVAEYVKIWYDDMDVWNKYECLMSNGDLLKYGEALYTTGAPDGKVWTKSDYDAFIALLGEEFLGKYIVDGDFLKEQASADRDAAAVEMNRTGDEAKAALKEYRTFSFQKAAEALNAQGIEASLGNGTRVKIIATKKQFREMELEDLAYWTFTTHDTNFTEYSEEKPE